MQLIVTTAHNPSPKMNQGADEMANMLGAPLIERGNRSLAALRQEYQTECIIISTHQGPVVNTPGGEYFFHLSMAELRIKNLINGKHDHMITAMELSPGMSVLDCTLGLATDAIVASYVAGTDGKVHGLEASPVIAAVTGLGLTRFSGDNDDITAAQRRISVIKADYNQYLPTLPDNVVDIVYFDPMFRIPVGASSNLKPIRFLADGRPLNITAVREACRVARKRVVVKETNGSREFDRLGVASVIGGKYSSVQYGIIEAGS